MLRLPEATLFLSASALDNFFEGAAWTSSRELFYALVNGVVTFLGVQLARRERTCSKVPKPRCWYAAGTHVRVAHCRFGVRALALSCVDIYGIMDFSLSQGSTETGSRPALCAARGQIHAVLLREAGWMTICA